MLFLTPVKFSQLWWTLHKTLESLTWYLSKRLYFLEHVHTMNLYNENGGMPTWRSNICEYCIDQHSQNKMTGTRMWN